MVLPTVTLVPSASDVLKFHKSVGVYVNISNLMLDSALIDSDVVNTRPVHNMSAFIPQSTQFIALKSPSMEQEPSPFSICCEG